VGEREDGGVIAVVAVIAGRGASRSALGPWAGMAACRWVALPLLVRPVPAAASNPTDVGRFTSPDEVAEAAGGEAECSASQRSAC